MTAAGIADAVPREPLLVAVLAGGRSSEHDVSLSSGAAVRDGLSAAGHEVVWVEIGRDGVWRQDGEPLSVTPAGGLLGVDVAFPVLHGPFGEDGTVQGLLETLDVAYVGAGVAASALCLNKVLFKELMSGLGVPQVDYVGVRAQRFDGSREQTLAEMARIARLGLPVFVKPAHLGSSVGIVKVSREEELADAVREAFSHDGLVIVEAMATGKEVECGVLGVPDERRRADGEAFVSKPGRSCSRASSTTSAPSTRPAAWSCGFPRRSPSARRCACASSRSRRSPLAAARASRGWTSSWTATACS